MKWYKVIERVSALPNSFVAGGWDLAGAQESDFTSGLAFSRVGTSQIKFWASGKDDDGELDDFLINDAMLPIIVRVPEYLTPVFVSHRLRNLVKKHLFTGVTFSEVLVS